MDYNNQIRFYQSSVNGMQGIYRNIWLNSLHCSYGWTIHPTPRTPLGLATPLASGPLYRFLLLSSFMQINPRRVSLTCLVSLKAWFHNGEIVCAKLCLRNMDGCTWVILLHFATLFAFAVSKADLSLLRMHDFISCEMFTHFAMKKRSWNQSL
jgi:hypothetical protein